MVHEQAFGPEEPPTAPHDRPPVSAVSPVSHVSGVHEAITQPAPYIEDLDADCPAVGSIPTSAIGTALAPIVELETGVAVAYGVRAGSTAVGLETAEELYARASMERRVGELGRVIREHALRAEPAKPLFIPTHPAELREGWLVRPDDPIASHEGEVFLELKPTDLTPICRQVLAELTDRPGVGICLAGFGTAASSIEMLVALAPTYVKASPTLLADVPADQRSAHALHRMTQLCRDLGAELIACGIENERQRRAVMRCGVRLADGPLLANR